MNTILDFTIYTTLTRGWSFWRSHYLLANAISFVIVVTWSFFWNKYWTFRERSLERGVQYFKFVIVTLVGLGIGQSVLSIGVGFFGVYDLIAKVIAGPAVVAWNFSAHRWWTFGRRVSVLSVGRTLRSAFLYRPALSGALLLAIGVFFIFSWIRSSSAALTLDSTGVTSDGNITLNGFATGTVTIGSNATTGPITIGSASTQNISITDDSWSITTGGVATFVGLIATLADGNLLDLSAINASNAFEGLKLPLDVYLRADRRRLRR